jgi:hypothetical protein
LSYLSCLFLYLYVFMIWLKNICSIYCMYTAYIL